MRKLSLDIDTLDVQSFETAEARSAEGTVLAHATNNQYTCGVEDECNTNLCTAVNCPKTYDCPSAYDACPSGRGCY